MKVPSPRWTSSSLLASPPCSCTEGGAPAAVRRHLRPQWPETFSSSLGKKRWSGKEERPCNRGTSALPPSPAHGAISPPPSPAHGAASAWICPRYLLETPPRAHTHQGPTSTTRRGN